MTGKLQKGTNQAKLSSLFPRATHRKSGKHPSDCGHHAFKRGKASFQPSELHTTNKETHKQNEGKPHFDKSTKCSKLCPAFQARPLIARRNLGIRTPLPSFLPSFLPCTLNTVNEGTRQSLELFARYSPAAAAMADSCDMHADLRPSKSFLLSTNAGGSSSRFATSELECLCRAHESRSTTMQHVKKNTTASLGCATLSQHEILLNSAHNCTSE